MITNGLLEIENAIFLFGFSQGILYSLFDCHHCYDNDDRLLPVATKWQVNREIEKDQKAKVMNQAKWRTIRRYQIF